MAKHFHINRAGDIHDIYCRCRNCKPPMSQVHALHRLKVALMFSGVLVGTLIAVRLGA